MPYQCKRARRGQEDNYGFSISSGSIRRRWLRDVAQHSLKHRIVFLINMGKLAIISSLLAVAGQAASFSPPAGPPIRVSFGVHAKSVNWRPMELKKSKVCSSLQMGADRVFNSFDAQGGKPIDPATTALVMIEYQVPFFRCVPLFMRRTPVRLTWLVLTERVRCGGWQASRCRKGCHGKVRRNSLSNRRLLDCTLITCSRTLPPAVLSQHEDAGEQCRGL
jgi:hypothetical protein